MILTKIVITKFHEKLRKSSFMFFAEIQIIKDDSELYRNTPIFNTKHRLSQMIIRKKLRVN